MALSPHKIWTNPNRGRDLSRTAVGRALGVYCLLTSKACIPSRFLMRSDPCSPVGEDNRELFMRNFPSDRTSAVAHWNLRQAPVDLVDSSENNPPTPSQMFTRLGVLGMLSL